MRKTLLLLVILLTFNTIQSQEDWTIYNTSNSDLTFDIISDIEIDSQGNKWIASWFNNGEGGIAKFDDSNWTIYNTKNQQGTSDIHKIEFTNGVIDDWVSVSARAVINFSDGSQITIDPFHDRTNNILIIEIPQNATNIQVNYYIEDASTVEMNFYNDNTKHVIHQETFSGQMNFEYNYSFSNNITTDLIIDISIDNLDNKWIGTWRDGIIKFDDTNWTNYTSSNSGLPDDEIICVATDNDNNVWVGTSSGLTKFDGTNWTTYNSSNSDLPTNSVVSIAIDNDNNVWLTTENELAKFTGTVWEIYNDNSVANHFGGPNSLVIDQNNVKWLSGGFGIKSFDGSNWEYFNFFGPNKSCLLDCQTTSLSIDTNNDLWVGTFQECNAGGLLNFSQCNPFLTTNSDLPDNGILSISIDNNGIKWIGTFNGLAKLETTLSVNETIIDNSNILFYPNPTKDYLSVEIENHLVGSEFVIFDAFGKKIKNGLLEKNKQIIDVKNLNKNLYFFNINNSNISKTIKFIIE